MTYKERLLASDAELKEANVDSIVAETEANLDATIAKRRANVVTLTNQRNELLNNVPLRVEAVESANQKVRDAQDALDNVSELKAELFGKSAKKG